MSGSTDRAADAFLQIGSQLDDILSFAQQVGVFLFVAESGELAYLGFHFPDVTLCILYVKAQLV